MAFTLIQAGGSLKSVNVDGALSAALTLPSGIQLAVNRIPRFARYGKYIIVANTPTRPVSVDLYGTVRLLTPTAPVAPVALSVGASGTLSGTYLALQTYLTKDSLGNIIAESDYGPAMTTAVAVAAHALHAAFAVSPEAVSATKLYRTATNGGVYFPWIVIDGNVATSEEDNIADSALGLIAAPDRGPAPDLVLVCEWNGRLWGVDRSDVDDLRYTESGTMYAWSLLNTIPIAPVGIDGAGISALIPRRNALGVGRKNAFSIISGTSRSNFVQTQVGREIGVESQESAVIYKDRAFFLWRDGVYTWDNSGFTCITDGKVRSWFTTNETFNRSMFWRAFAQLDPVSLSYRLYLASAGSTVIDRWIEYDLSTGAWWGPHKTDAFSPTSAITVFGADQQPYPMIGSQEGYLSLDQSAENDWELTPVAMSVETKTHDQADADVDKFWGELSVVGKVQPSGLVTVTPSVGNLDTMTAQAPMSHTLASGRSRLDRIGSGTQMSLKFDEATLNTDVVLYGFEVNPVNIIGRR